MTQSDATKQIFRQIVPPRYRGAIRSYAARAAHFGTRRFCPCCNSHVRQFGPYGEQPRSDAMCPVCGALERHRLSAMFLNRRHELLAGLKRVLHVAPEPPVERVLRRWTQESYISIDLSEDNVLVQGDLTGMPFRSQSFDAIYCSHVLEHVPDDMKAMNELRRVLRPGGWAIIQVPITRQATFEDTSITDPERRRQLFGQRDHVRVYGYDFPDRLARARFSVSIERPQTGLGRKTMTRCGLNTKENIFFCTKAH